MTFNIEFSALGRTVRILNATNGNLIAEILVHGFLKRAFDSSEFVDAGASRYVFRGELFQLAGYEFLDIPNEQITERENI